MTPTQARAARSMLKIGVREVADGASVTPNTISRIEADLEEGKRGPQSSTINSVKLWYISKGITFLDDGAPAKGTGVSYIEPESEG